MKNIPVQNSPGLVRDLVSGAILNANLSQVQDYLTAKKKAQARNTEINSLIQQLREANSKIDSLNQRLSKLEEKLNSCQAT